MNGNVDSIRLLSISLGWASQNAALGGCVVHKLDWILVTVSNKPLETVDMRDINRDTGGETFFEFSLKEEKWR